MDGPPRPRRRHALAAGLVAALAAAACLPATALAGWGPTVPVSDGAHDASYLDIGTSASGTVHAIWVEDQQPWVSYGDLETVAGRGPRRTDHHEYAGAAIAVDQYGRALTIWSRGNNEVHGNVV